MGNIRASSWLDYDASNEATSLGKQASRLAGAKKSGGGWGALLGGILGQILIPIPGVGAAIGAGLGGAAGSVASGAMSGVSQDDIRSGGKFYKGSRESILNTIAANQMDQSLEILLLVEDGLHKVKAVYQMLYFKVILISILLIL